MPQIPQLSKEGAYYILGIRPPFTSAQLKTVFRTLAKRHHPDAGGDPRLFRQAKEAYDLLVPDAREEITTEIPEDIYNAVFRKYTAQQAQRDQASPPPGEKQDYWRAQAAAIKQRYMQDAIERGRQARNFYGAGGGRQKG